MTATLQVKKERPNYYVVLDYRSSDGTRKRKWIATDIPTIGNNKRKAEQRRKEILSEYEQLDVEEMHLSKDILFTDFMREWMENQRASIATTTFDGYCSVVYRQIIPFFEPKKLKLRDMTSLHVQQYIRFKLKTVSTNTVKKHLANLSKCFSSAVRQHLIHHSPMLGIEPLKQVRYVGAKFYDETEIERLLEVFKGDILEPVILFAVYYGMRRSEILGLKWSAIHFKDKTFTISHTVVQSDGELHKMNSTKNRSSFRTLPLSNTIIETLKRLKEQQTFHRTLQPNDYANDEGYVFVREDGRLLLPDFVSHRFRRLLKQNGLPIVRFHDLRHSAASYLLHLGFNLKEIQVWLGHSDFSTTANTYAHLDMSAKREIAERLNEKFTAFG